MGNLRRRGCGSSSLWRLYNTYTNYNLNDGADDCIFFTAIIYKFHMCYFSFWHFNSQMHKMNKSHPQDRIESKLSGATQKTLLTCIWSSGEERSGYGETGSPSADMSRPLEWHSLCLGNLCPFPVHRMLLHWHLCPHLSPSLSKERKSRNCYCEHEKEGAGESEM